MQESNWAGRSLNLNFVTTWRKFIGALLILLSASNCMLLPPVPPMPPMEGIPADTPKDVKAEIEHLYSPSAITRAYAIIALGEKKARAKNAIPYLEPQLADDSSLAYNWNPYKRATSPGQLAGSALGDIGGSARKTLEASLTFDNPVVVLNALRGIAKLGQEKDYETISGLIEHPYHGVRTAVVSILGATRESKYKDLISERLINDDWYGVRKKAAWAMYPPGSTQDGEKYIGVLTEALSDWSKWVSDSAIESLGRISGEKVIDVFCKVISDSSSVYTQKKVTLALGEIGKDLSRSKEDRANAGKVVECLKSAVRDKNQDLVKVALSSLGKITHQSVTSALVEALNNPNWKIRIAALNAMNLNKKPEFKAVLESLNDPNPKVRAVVVDILSKSKRQQALPSLVQVLRQDKDASVRSKVAEDLGRIGDKRSVDPLIASLDDDDDNVRREVALALGRIGDKRSVDPLIASLDDADDNVRREVALALGRIGDKRAVDPLIKLLGDTDNGVREKAAESLGNIGDKQAVAPLIELLGDADSDVREEAADSLAKIGDKRAVGPLIKLLGDAEYRVREKAVESLGKIGDKRAVAPLIALIGDAHLFVRAEAARVLKQLTGKDFGDDIEDHEKWVTWYEQQK